MTFFHQHNSPLSIPEREFLDKVIAFEKRIPNQRWRARFKASTYDTIHVLLIENQFSKNAVRVTYKYPDQYKLELLSRNPHEAPYVGTPFQVDRELKVSGTDLCAHAVTVGDYLHHTPTRFNRNPPRLEVTRDAYARSNYGRTGGPLFAGRIKSLKIDHSHQVIDVEVENTSCTFRVSFGEEGVPLAARTGGYLIYNLGYSATNVSHMFASEAHACKMFMIEDLYIGRTVGVVA